MFWSSKRLIYRQQFMQTPFRHTADSDLSIKGDHSNP